jgi:predicted ATPase/transcriptional regulator with XRE-family HTH domain
MSTGASTFHAWIKQRRRALDLTQEDLADCVGCSMTTIQKIELGGRRPSKQVAQRLAECLNIPAGQQDEFVRFARESAGAFDTTGLGGISASAAVSASVPSPNGYPTPAPTEGNPTNLPMQLTSFVGRTAEVPRVRDLMLTSEVRLLTLTGPPGTGKTRLALQVAAHLLNDLRDGVFFVNLAPITDPDLVISQIAQTLGVGESTGKSMLDGVKAYLGGKQVLMVLDNFEQVVEAAPVVGELLMTAPNLKVMATSRVPLHIRGEREFAVSPLQLPDLQHLPPLERLGWYEAVRLFVERATDVNADFELTEDNASAIAHICVRLDGLPLAVELAAARVKVLSPQAIRSRLESRYELLTGGPRDLPARQRTLRSAIEWSYDLLDENEKKLFRRLAVFLGGFTLEAAEMVCWRGTGDARPTTRNPETGFQDRQTLLDGIVSLVDKSLLQQHEGVGGEPRFAMLETIHEYAGEILEESGESEEMRRLHALYFLELAEQAEPHLVDLDQTL